MIWRRRMRLASAAFLGVWSLSAAGLSAWLQWIPVEAPLPQEAPPPPSPAGEERPWLVVPDRIRRGDTLAGLLSRNGMSAREAFGISEALSAHLDVRRLRAGDEVELHYDARGNVEALRLHRGRLEIFEIRRDGEEWRGNEIPVVLERREVVRHGLLEGSLFSSMEALGETAALVVAFAEVFAWDFDFYTQSRPGDRFSLLVEKLYRDGEFVTYGDLLAASYTGDDRRLSAFLFENPETGEKGFFDPEGSSMRKAFLRAPLRFERISSRFSYNRLHPIHRRRMPHLGVDYAAPTGTPVHAVGSGVVVGISRGGPSGNMVTLRHAMGYGSKYLHLSRFAKGLRVGKRVEQKEVIGYVGATGTATAPHLDFRLLKHGKPVNPLKEIFPPGPPVPDEHRPAFRATVERLSAALSRPADQRSTAGR